MSDTQIEPQVSSFVVDGVDDRAQPIASQARPKPWWIAVVVLAVIAAAGYFYWRQQQPAPAPTAPPAVEVPPVPKAEPAVRYPIEDARARLSESTERTPLPSLGDSDGPLREALAAVTGPTALERFLYPQDIARRFVATIDNLLRKSVAPQVMVLKPVPGAFVAGGSEGRLVIAADNASRYTPYVRLAQSADTAKLVGLYVRYYPWFEQAYRDLGYPNGHFNDRLVDVIDSLLATPDVAGPVMLIQPRVLYQFADPTLEALPAGQKIMIRMGSENSAQLKAKLREVRRALTGAVAPTS